MGRTACTEPPRLYKGALFLTAVSIKYHERVSVFLT